MIRPFLTAAFTAVALTIVAAPALAGTLNYSGSSAQWQSTKCQQPVAPNFVKGPANDLSANVTIQNNYTQAVNQYLQCLSQEATADMNTVQSQVAAQLAQVNAAWQADLAKREAEMATLRHR